MSTLRDIFTSAAVKKAYAATLLAIGIGGMVAGGLHAMNDEPYAINGLAGGAGCIFFGIRGLRKLRNPRPD